MNRSDWTPSSPARGVSALVAPGSLVAPTDVATSTESREVRPPPGPARGLVPVPAWAVVALASALVVGTLAYLVLRSRRGKKS